MVVVEERGRVAGAARARAALLLALAGGAAPLEAHALPPHNAAAARHRALAPLAPTAPYFAALQPSFVVAQFYVKFYFN